MPFVDAALRYLIQLSLAALICSAIFWALASGALAIKGNTKKPILHLVLGGALHFIWFFVVCILALVNLKTKDSQPEPLDSKNASSPPVRDPFSEAW